MQSIIKKIVLLTAVASLLVLSAPSQARNDLREFSIADAFALEKFKQKLGDDIVFKFGNSNTRRVVKKHGTWPTQKKTNAFNKTDEFACQWALLSALLSLKKRTQSEGGNAVINIQTNNNHNAKSNSQMFECEVGNVVASVALIGTVVTLK